MSQSKADYILTERVALISYTTVGGALYGFAFALYIFCARSLYLQLEDRDRHRQRLFTLLYMSLVMALALCAIAVNTRDMQVSYVDHADYPGGGSAYSNVFAGSPTGNFGAAVTVLLDLMIYGIQIWRLQIVWRASRYSIFIVVLPVLALLANIGFQTTEIVRVAPSGGSGGSGVDPHLVLLLFYGQIAAQFCISVTVTFPIIIRIVMVRRKNMEIMGKTDIANPYTSVISMLIESFSLEFVWMVPLFIDLRFVPVTPPSTFFFGETQQFIQLLSYLFVVYRVTTGRGWKEDTAEKLTTLQWNRDGLQTNQISNQASIPITHEEV